MNKHHHTGFHLIEILITLALIAIMGNLMLGRYHHFMTDTRRKQAIQELYSLASAMESYAIEHSTYAGADFKNLKINPVIADGHYLLMINHAKKQEYLISARPLSHQAEADTHCGTLLLSSSGKTSVTGTASTSECF